VSPDRATLGSIEVGDTGVVVSRLGLGAAPLAGLFAPVSDEAARSTLAAAFDAGISLFDTAPHYGAGLSEERVGAYLSTRPRDEFVLCTKTGRLLVDTDEDVEGAEGFYATPRRRRVRDYSAAGIRRSIEESLVRLGLDRIDIALIHDPDDYGDVAFGESVAALVDLRRAGVVRAIGAGMNQVEMLERFVVETDIDCILVAGRYSLLENSAAARLFPACLEHHVAVFVGGVYKSGILADPRPGTTVDYGPAPAETIEHVQAIRAVCERHGVALPAAALHYVLAHPAVTAAVVGARSAREVEENAAHYATEVPDALYAELGAAGLIPPWAGGRT
jgi:D-threo-aldose 1-dehydrogenase